MGQDVGIEQKTAGKGGLMMKPSQFEPRSNPDGTYETLVIEKEGGIDWLMLNRPEALNAMSRTMMLELQHYFGKLYTDQSVRVVIVTGAGRGFCAGLDLKEDRDADELGPVNGLRVQRRVSEIIMRMRRAPQAIVSLIHGPASGGGFALALASDIRIAGPAARMNAAFIRLGLTACDVGVSYFLPRLVGSALASELLLTGRFIDAERALQVGLVSSLVPEDQLREAGRGIAEEILANSPVGVRLTKECLNMSVDAGGLEAVIAMEDRQQILTAQTGDMREGVAAFLEKRPAAFEDR
jgi:enoyl-CoA hydratase